MNKFFWPVVLVTVFTIVACVLVINEYEKKDTHKGQAAPVTGMVSEAQEDVPESEKEPDISKDTQSFTGIVTGYDPEEGLIVFKDTDSDKTAAFHYDGTTAFYDRFGQSLTAQELKPGDVTDVSYNLADGMLAKVSMSNDCFTMTDVVKFSVDEKKRIFSIAGEPYKFTEDIFIYSDDEKSEWMDITNLDTLTVRGKEKNIYSVVVTKGHGYLRLKNDSYFIGGWIEGGNEIIKPGSKDMLIP